MIIHIQFRTGYACEFQDGKSCDQSGLESDEGKLDGGESECVQKCRGKYSGGNNGATMEILTGNCHCEENVTALTNATAYKACRINGL